MITISSHTPFVLEVAERVKISTMHGTEGLVVEARESNYHGCILETSSVLLLLL